MSERDKVITIDRDSLIDNFQKALEELLIEDGKIVFLRTKKMELAPITDKLHEALDIAIYHTEIIFQGKQLWQ